MKSKSYICPLYRTCVCFLLFLPHNQVNGEWEIFKQEFGGFFFALIRILIEIDLLCSTF